MKRTRIYIKVMRSLFRAHQNLSVSMIDMHATKIYLNREKCTEFSEIFLNIMKLD